MAIELLDNEPQEDNNEDFSSIEENTEQAAQDTQDELNHETVSEEGDELPEKYRNKPVAEVAKMHMEAEKALGRKGGEVGELRKIVDDFIKVQLEAKTAPVQTNEDPPDDDDWYLDPEKAVNRAIANHPKLKQAEQLTAQMHQANVLQELKSAHPDFADIIRDPNFEEWVKASRIRQQLLVQADQNYDLDAANELLGNWKERKGAAKTAVAQEQSERKKQVKAASTGSASGSGEAPSRKIYRRTDIIKLMQTDPDRYLELADEISQAYAEKRVR